MKAAFAGGLGPEMKAKADEWAHETPDIKSLPVHKGKGKKSTTEHALSGLKKAAPKKSKKDEGE